MTVRASSIFFGLVAATWFAIGCGDSGGGNPLDGGQSDRAQTDRGQTDVYHPPTDSGTDGSLPCEFNTAYPCDIEWQDCTTVGSATTECGGFDCVSTAFGNMCLRPCSCSDACQKDTFCVPKGLTNFANTQFASLGGYCFFSFCGGGDDPNHTYGNGLPLGPCEVGGDKWLRPGKVDKTRPGVCYVFNSETSVGGCYESGTAARGESCTFDTGATCSLREGWTGCAQDSLCIGRSGEAVGTCAKLCDPSKDGFDPAVAGGDCAADSAVTHDQYCQDSSDYGFYTNTGGMYVGYVGFCVDDHGCDALVATNQCEGTGKLCYPTSNVSSYGLCLGPDGTSTDTCETAGNSSDPTKNCASGYICLGTETIGECHAYCGRGATAGTKDCAGTDTCEKVQMDDDDTPADNYSLNWGACQPAPDGGVAQQDGGAEDGGTD